ncbi:citrate synthase family protein [Robbsia andropogonis]|uniref:citrate synthase family protein n=1 Tax=Robbsia andropogonis TaxID=28092 RepID=UPI0004AFC4E3|nr:citrate synthase family protein [Robbsia andropogonis]
MIDSINVKDWMTQEEACAALDVRQQTLYAYVSRGQIEVRRDPSRVGRNRYSASDVRDLLHKRNRGRARTTIAASTMAWGEPIVSTRISTVVRGRLYYRGLDAIQLSETDTLEETAQRLWWGEADGQAGRPALSLRSNRNDIIGDRDTCSRTPPYFSSDWPQGGMPPSCARAYAMLGRAAAEGVPSDTQGFPDMLGEAARLVGRLASGFVPFDVTATANAPEKKGRPRQVLDMRALHLRIAAAWRADRHADLLRRALVLLADQELTTSAFAARVTASTGASLGACALAGLAALSGPRHGGAPERVRRFLDEAARDGVENRIGAALTASDPATAPLSGFGHPLYPQGDPRAASLLAAFPVPDVIRATIEYVDRRTSRKPTIDVALVALAEYCALPDDAAFALFAIGRSVGWMAHAMEQVNSGTLLRPRAHYLGPPIAEEPSS